MASPPNRTTQARACWSCCWSEIGVDTAAAAPVGDMDSAFTTALHLASTTTAAAVVAAAG